MQTSDDLLYFPVIYYLYLFQLFAITQPTDERKVSLSLGLWQTQEISLVDTDNNTPQTMLLYVGE